MGGIELLTTAEMAEADRLAVAAGVPSLTLMENAGRAIANEAARMVAPAARIVVLCGPGNNGGDGFVAARLLKERGYDVGVALLGDRARLKGDAAAMAARWTGDVLPATGPALAGADLVIDALFGAGLARPLDGAAAAMVEAVNAGGAPVLAVDVPSGLDGTTGQTAGPVVRATRTVTFFRRKPGHLLLPGRALCGAVVVADIAIPVAVLASIAPRTMANAEPLWLDRLPWPRLDGHKYARGHAVVVSGAAEMAGAARLSARGALRVGAGLVTLVGGPAATAINAAHVSAVMVRRVEGAVGLAEFLADERRNAALIGPGAGVGMETAADVLAVLASKAAAVLDADALTSFADAEAPSRPGFGFVRRDAVEGARPADLFAAIKGRTAPVVVTPHDGEFKRLFGATGEGAKLGRARQAAAASGAVVVLKGPDTVIAAPDGRAAINENAPPWLATAGSGDVLAGYVTGLLAQGMPAFEAACAAVWLHGACATEFGPGLIAEDLPEVLPKLLARLHGRHRV
jgi:NAD(P)H-hydrate epimerase